MRFLTIALFALLLAVQPALAQNFVAQPQGRAPKVAHDEKAPPEQGNRALEFLARVQEKNKELRTLQAGFEQVRKDLLFEDTVESDGEFWYRSPDFFRASYDSDNPSHIWIRDNKVYNYVPALKQVEVIRQAQGKKKPINQLLLGFGVDVKEIEEIFHVSLDEKASKNGQIAVLFVSRDLERSMEFEEITVIFDESSVEPRRLILKNPESIFTITLKQVKFNPEIKDTVFETDWPADVEVLDYSTN